TVIFTFLFGAFFDTAGALIGLTSQSWIMKVNTIPNASRASLAVSTTSMAGASLRTSSHATSIESSTAITVEDRRRYTSDIIAACFAIALFFSPILAVITTEITAPALIIVGSMMAMQISKIDWSKLEIVIPSFLTIIMMPLTSSVATGIAFGFILYPLSLAAQKRFKEIHP